MKRELELYLHIPFCVQKCKYCDFLSAPSGESERQEYVERLCRRIRYYGEPVCKANYVIVSIFVGGGTPSILTEGQITQIFEAVRESFDIAEDAEITLEMNPGTDVREKLSVYRKLGINRLSIGLQSADDKELKCLGRIHTYDEFLKVYQAARQEGFTNINVDLMSAIPRQTMESYERTLRRIAELEPEHISAYSLIIEEGTPFYERYGEGRHAEELPDEETERQMYVRTREILESYGYHRYEISNYAKDGYECRHNLGYWDRIEYLGLGAGASSLMEHIRWKEPDYIGPSLGMVMEEREEFTRLSRREEMEEFMFLGLRKVRGISTLEFWKCFHELIDEVYHDPIEELIRDQLLVREGDRIRLTDKGIDLSNYALSHFLLEN